MSKLTERSRAAESASAMDVHGTEAAAASAMAAETAAPEGRGDMSAEVGRLVRQARAKRGMKRKTLARLSDTSERYLAQIEKGDGNPTILVLDSIARGLGLELFDLLPLGVAEQSKLALVERIRRMSETQVAALARMLERGSAHEPTGLRARRVALIGLRGAGKSTLGSALAERLKCPFVELDKMIEGEYGAPVAALFEVYGQATFRRYERECLERIVATSPQVVIATAGGLVADERTFGYLLERSHVIWLRASPADHMRRVMEQGDFRPMARNREAMTDLVSILSAREAEYGRAHAQLDTSGRSVEDSAEALARIAEDLFGATAQPEG